MEREAKPSQTCLEGFMKRLAIPPAATMWKNRPSAFLSGNQYERARRSKLEEAYENDNTRATKEGVKIPPRPREEQWRQRRHYLRTCQRNVFCFRKKYSVATEIVQTLLDTDADIIVLNEFGGASGDQSERSRDHAVQLLQDAGYSVAIAACTWPTAIATRLPIHQSTRFSLDHIRDAVALQIQIDPTPADADAAGEDSSRLLWIYGTHLEDGDFHGGKFRLLEMEALLGYLQKNLQESRRDEETSSMNHDVLLVGDFNQQRQQDYTEEEWGLICANKRQRASPPSDGVADLLEESGFSCVWDEQHFRHQPSGTTSPSGVAASNWKPGSPPPSTHWTGTVIDYTWYRRATDNPVGSKHSCIKRLHGVYVSPSNLSDHRLVVCDWELT